MSFVKILDLIGPGIEMVMVLDVFSSRLYSQVALLGVFKGFCDGLSKTRRVTGGNKKSAATVVESFPAAR